MVYTMSCIFINTESKINETDSFFVALSRIRPDSMPFDFHDQPVPCHPILCSDMR